MATASFKLMKIPVGKMSLSSTVLFVILVFCCVNPGNGSVIQFQQTDFLPTSSEKNADANEPKQSWNYLTVRDKAHMFWWLYETEAQQGWQNVPLILWLQGGPGASGTGFGNFEEIGPLNVRLEKRNTTWLKYASLLFVDNPVGAGYSYVEDKSAFCADIDCIAKDLLTLIDHLMVSELKKFQKVPFYIFSESYGGKMASVFGKYLYEAKMKKGVPINFQGVALGDSWIAPAMYVQSWAPYLYTTSLVGKPGFDAVRNAANHVTMAINNKEWTNATALWTSAEQVVENHTDGVNFYNILKWTDDSTSTPRDRVKKSAADRHLGVYATHGLTALMNGFIRHKLQIIPDNVTWGGQMQDVFSAQAGEFMKPVIDTVDYLLKETDLQVIVYNGQLDLICDTLGTEGWVQTLTWSDLQNFFRAPRTCIHDLKGVPRAFVRKYKKFSFYWILEAGHMIPQDQGESSVMLLKSIIGGKSA